MPFEMSHAEDALRLFAALCSFPRAASSWLVADPKQGPVSEHRVDGAEMNRRLLPQEDSTNLFDILTMAVFAQ